MRVIFLLSFLIISKLSFCQNLIITELADPNDADDCRYVEIYNPTSTDIDLMAEGFSLQRWTNGNTDPQSPRALTGTINAGEFFIVCRNSTEFANCYSPETCDLQLGQGGPADSNGDDQIAIIDCNGDIIDLFGNPGTDGSGEWHEFEDGRAERVSTVCNPESNPNVAMNWNVCSDAGSSCGPINTTTTGANAFDPRSWSGSGTCTGQTYSPCSTASCGVELGTATISCSTNNAGDNNDGVTISIPYTGIDAGITSVTTTSGGTVAGDDPATETDGTITITGLQEGDTWDITLVGGGCDGTTTNGTVPADECDPIDCPFPSTLNFQMINPCGDDGGNEFLSFTTGDPTDIADLAFGVTSDASDASWNYFWGGSNTNCMDYACIGVTSCGATTSYDFLVPGVDDAEISARVDELNSVANCTPPLFTAAPATIPAGADVVVFLGDQFDDVSMNLDFSNNCGNSYYAVFGTGTGQGYFSNSSSRLSTLDFGGGCDCVTQFDYTPRSGEAGYVFNGQNYQTGGPCVPPSVILPVEYLTFTVEHKNSINLLRWATASETNNDRFEIERSEDGLSFETIGEVFGQGDSRQRNDYSFSDEHFKDGINYYRLKQIDYDGKYEYSKIISVLSTLGSTIVNYSTLNSTVEIVATTQYQYHLYSSDGKLLKYGNHSDNHSIDLSALGTGVYILQVIDSYKNAVTERIIKF